MRPNRHPKKRIIGIALFSGLVATGIPLLGQDNADDDEIYELSPFTVEATDNVGYVATSTLAGTRIKTPLRDVGAAISVITPEFLEDTGATNADTILSYSVNTEVSGEQGNFAGGAGVTDLRENPQNKGQRIRGIASASLTRGFFLTDIPFDSYNTSRVTINRGPNSLLFGVGSPGGIINNAVKEATIGNTFGEVSLRLGERGSHRETLDYNLEVIDSRLAVRIAALNEDTQYNQRPAYEDDQRLYAAFDAVLHEGKSGGFFGRTRLKGNYEEGKIEGTPVNVIPPKDGFSDWFGIRLDGRRAEIEGITGVTLPGWVDNSFDDGTGQFSPKTIINTLPGAPLGAHGFPNNMSWWVNLPIIWNGPDTTESGVGFPNMPEVDGVLSRVIWNNAPEYGRNRFETPHSTSVYSGSRTPGFTSPVILDQNILNNEKIQLTGKTDYVSHDFDAMNFALEQSLFDGKGGIELAYDEQTYENYSVFPFRGEIRVDTTSHLTNDQPNPNVGRAFIYGNTLAPQVKRTSRESERATAFYDLDFTENEGWLSWLGQHVITGLWNKQTIDRLDKSYNFNWTETDSHLTAADILTGPYAKSTRRTVVYGAFLTPSLLGSEYQQAGDLNLNNPIDVVMPKDGDQFLISWNDHPVPSVNPAGVPAGVDPLDYVPGTGDPSWYNNFETTEAFVGALRNEQEITSKAVSLQSKFWNGNIVGLLGWRNDKSVNTPQATYDLLEDGRAAPSQMELSDTSESPKEGDTITKSLVFHLPKELIDLGRTRVSFHYNESENFSPESTRRNIRGEELPSPTGTTEEYGIGMEFMDGAISLRVSKYQMTSDYVEAGGLFWAAERIVNPVGATRWAYTQLDQTPFEDAIALSDKFPATYREDFQSYDELQEAIRQAIPADIRAQVNPRFEPALPDPLALYTYDPIVGRTATKSFTSEGTEIELVGNITSNWRLSINIAQQETVQSNTAPVLYEVAQEYAQNLKDLGLWDTGDEPDNNTDDTFGTRFTNSTLLPLATQRAKDNTRALEQREWRVNIATNYMFTDGLLDGFAIGGAYRYQSKAAVGYEMQTVEGVYGPNLDKPLWGPEEWNADLWASYSRPLTRDIDWKIQVNLRNAFGNDDMIPVVINPDGRVAVARNSNPMEFFVTNTFSF